MAQGDTNLTAVVCNMGDGTGTFNSDGVLNLQYTQSATAANTTETTGHTYTLPAKSLATNGKAVRVRVWGTTGATVNNKTVKIYLGSTVLYTTGAVAANAKDFYLDCLIVRTGAATQTALITGHFNGSPITASSRATATETLSSDLIIKSTMTNGTAAASDVICNGFEVTALP